MKAGVSLSARCGTVLSGAEIRALSREQVSGPALCSAPGLLGFGMADVIAPLRSQEKWPGTRSVPHVLVLTACLGSTARDTSLSVEAALAMSSSRTLAACCSSCTPAQSDDYGHHGIENYGCMGSGAGLRWLSARF